MTLFPIDFSVLPCSGGVLASQIDHYSQIEQIQPLTINDIIPDRFVLCCIVQVVFWPPRPARRRKTQSRYRGISASRLYVPLTNTGRMDPRRKDGGRCYDILWSNSVVIENYSD